MKTTRHSERSSSTIRLFFSLAALFALACSEPAPATPDAHVEVADASEPDGGPRLDPRFEPLAEALRSDLDRNLATGASVAVWLDDEIVWVGGFGSADPEGERAPGPDTLFMIGSDTKKMASILLLQEIEAGHATLETTLGDVLPDLVMRAAPDFPAVTVHELISHQGGIVDTTGDFTTETTDEVLRDYTYGAFARSAYAMAPPGLFFNYSNPNFSMAGLITETLAGTSWADLARTRLFEPLGMSRTFARKSEVDADSSGGVGLSGPRDTMPGPVAFEGCWENAWVRPAGMVWSTPSDQMRLARFLVDGDERVLSADSLARLHARHVPSYPDLPGHYAYGLSIEDGIVVDGEYREMEVWMHGGNTLTHTSTFWVLPEQRFAISILSNGYGDDFNQSVLTAIESLVTLPAPSTAPTPSVDSDVVDGLVGTYSDPHNVGDIIVTRAGAALGISMPALDTAGVPYSPTATPISTRVWRTSIQGRPQLLLIYDGPDGETYLVHRAFVAMRPAAAPAPAPPPAVLPHALPSREQILRALRRAEQMPAPPSPWLR